MPKKTRRYGTVISCKIAQNDIELIDRICRAVGISRSKFIRGALRVHLRTFFGGEME